MNDSGFGVDPTDDVESDGEIFERDVTEDDLVEQIREARETLEHLEDNPDEVLAVGVVVAYTDETTQTCTHDDHEHVADGMVMRLINPTAHEGYRDVASLLQDAEQFDAQLEDIKLAGGDGPDVEAMGVSLGDLFGGGPMG